ncbi:MAG: cysteine peptidase family C39 domain-containing protein [Candidatus Nanopelagicales bacterium]
MTSTGAVAPGEVNPRSKARTPTILQMEMTECGAASLGMVLAYFGKRVELQELRETCSTSRDGINAAQIVRAARHYGLEADGYLAKADSLPRRPMPMILYWEFNHFVVLESVTKRHYVINDPAVGRRKLTHEEFDASYSGVAIAFEKGPNFEPGRSNSEGLRAGDVFKSMVKGSGPAVSFSAIAGIAVAVPVTLAALVTSLFVEQVLNFGLTNWVPIVIGLAAIVVVLDFSLTWLSERMLLRLHLAMSIRASTRFIWHLLRLPSRFYDARSPGGLVSRVSLNEGVASSVTGQLSTAAVNLVKMLIYLVVLIWINPTLAAIAIVFGLLSACVIGLSIRYRIQANTTVQQEALKDIGYTYTGLAMFDDIRAAGAESEYLQRKAGRQAKVVSSEQRFSGMLAIFSSIPKLFNALAIAGILLVGGYMVLNAQLSVGQLIAFQALALSFLAPIGSLVMAVAMLADTKAQLVQIADVLGEPVRPEAQGQVLLADPNPETAGRKLEGKLEVKDLTFGFSKSRPPLIENLSFTANPGERIALIGTSGSGKSTVANLIAGLYEPWAGEILLDGRSRIDVPVEVVTSSLTKVDQSIMLFEGTIEANIRFWDDSIELDRVIAAAEDADIAQEIEAKAGGYSHKLTEGGSNLSGGQRQRIEIARALAKDPTILILDEATSALDAVTEHEIANHLKTRNCTCVIIAHRLSTVRDCDQILVLDQGKLVEQGNHDQLIALDGYYAELMSDG